MTTYVGHQNADIHRLGQKSVLIAESSIRSCELSPLQMSGAPFQPWTYITDGRYTNARTHAPEADPLRHTTASNPHYQAQEPPRFHLPVTQSHEPTMMQTSSYPRFPLQAWDSGTESKYNFTPNTTGSLAQYSIQRPSMSRPMEHAGPSSSYYDDSVRSRGSVGSVGRINDVDSQ